MGFIFSHSTSSQEQKTHVCYHICCEHVKNKRRRSGGRFGLLKDLKDLEGKILFL